MEPKPVPPESQDSGNCELYVNRELSLLEFQRRVLEEALDERNPILERVKFLAIVASNLNEFFMVRVAGLKQMVAAGVQEISPDGLTPRAQLKAIRDKILSLIGDARGSLKEKMLPELAAAGIHILDYASLSVSERAHANQFFNESVFPVLTPLAFDPGRPFPHISNLSLNVAVLLRDHKDETVFARIKVPDSLPQLVVIPPADGEDTKTRARFIWLEQIIQANLGSLFPGMEILETHVFQVTRNADLVIQELEADDLLETIEESIRRRRFGAVVRLQVNADIPDSLLEILSTNLEIELADVYRVEGPLALHRIMALAKLDRPELKFAPFLQGIPSIFGATEEDKDIFEAIRGGPILMHHPYDSFDPVVRFLESAADDPDVLAIKVTLYRVGPNSPIVEALLRANENGKQVAALVELKARFDEESNIHWARSLESEGVHVVYGLLGLKTHCKVALVVRQEGQTIRRYVHLSTGNYNATTALMYTDLGLFTCDPQIGADASDLFNYLTGYSAKEDYRKLLVAPINLRTEIETLIRREIDHQRKTGNGRLILKMNSLMDKSIIRLLYEASQEGVEIDLIIRGICGLRPGLPGLSETIRVRSIVGRFLEHSRIYYFGNGGAEEMYLGSADLMTRNLDHRVETFFPIENPELRRFIKSDVLDVYLSDNDSARIMRPDGTYYSARTESSGPVINSQRVFLSRVTPPPIALQPL